jgi:hypothetical protein
MEDPQHYSRHNPWPIARCNAEEVLALFGYEMAAQRPEPGPEAEQTLHSKALRRGETQSDSTTESAQVLPETIDILEAFMKRLLRRSCRCRSTSTGHHNISAMLLPASDVLKMLLASHRAHFALSFSLTSDKLLDVNELVSRSQSGTLLVLLMLAHGIGTTATQQDMPACHLLLEAARSFVLQHIEHSPVPCTDPILLECALLSSTIGAWSGHQWYMDSANARVGMHIASLKHAGMLHHKKSKPNVANEDSDVRNEWRHWIQNETRSRIVYNWVLLDLQMSIFYDRFVALSISDLHCSLPSVDDNLLGIQDAEFWYARRTPTPRVCGADDSHHYSWEALSLHEMFQLFLHDNLEAASLTPVALKLLLYPIHGLLTQIRGLLSCFSGVLSPLRQEASPQPSMSKQGTLIRLAEVQSLLGKWLLLHNIVAATANCLPLDIHMHTTSLVLYHAICLNAVADILCIEHISSSFDGSIPAPNYWDLSLAQKRCIFQSSEALYHCGQLFRLLSSNEKLGMPLPMWTPLAIYRATIVFWFYTLSCNDPSFPSATQSGKVVVLNIMLPDDAILQSWLWNGEGSPALETSKGLTRFDDAGDILLACIAILNNLRDQGSSTELHNGVVARLRLLWTTWHNGGSRDTHALNSDLG